MSEGALPPLMPVLHPPLPAMTRATACARAFMDEHAVAAVLLPPDTPAAPARALRELCRAREVALLTVVARAEAITTDTIRELDGAHLLNADGAAVARLRRRLGKEAIIGACCPTTRHAAMELGEAGIDYIAIDQRVQARGENLLAWWARVCVVPVLAAHPVTPPEAPRLKALGADFLVPREDMWEGPATARATARALAET